MKAAAKNATQRLCVLDLTEQLGNIPEAWRFQSAIIVGCTS